MDHKSQRDAARAASLRSGTGHGQDSSGRLPDRRWKSKTEMLAEDMVKDAEKMGLHMEIDRGR